jgi:hypothetical protein
MPQRRRLAIKFCAAAIKLSHKTRSISPRVGLALFSLGIGDLRILTIYSPYRQILAMKRYTCRSVMSGHFGTCGSETNAMGLCWGDAKPVPARSARPRESSSDTTTRDLQLTSLVGLASVNIETSLVTHLSGSLHSLFDDVCVKTLPIYFGPLLGRLYLEGL